MSVNGLMLVTAFAAGLLALWVDARLEGRTPQSMMGTFVHVPISAFIVTMSPKLILIVVGGTESPVRKMAALLLAFLPALVYAWLSSIWMLKLLQRAALRR
jgi:hypothetical protein